MSSDLPIATYSFQLHAFVPTRVYTLFSDKLVWKELNENGAASENVEIWLVEIIELSLRFAPSRFQLARCTANIALRKGGSLTLASGHYLNAGNFEDRRDTFTSFVRALSAALAHANPAAKFTRGYLKSSLLLGIALGLMGIALFIMLLPVLLAIGIVAIIPLAILLFSVPAAVAEIRRNWPGNYDPFNIPSELLPNSPLPPRIDPALAKIVRAITRR